VLTGRQSLAQASIALVPLWSSGAVQCGPSAQPTKTPREPTSRPCHGFLPNLQLLPPSLAQQSTSFSCDSDGMLMLRRVRRKLATSQT
jgi:hypothetical protein